MKTCNLRPKTQNQKFSIARERKAGWKMSIFGKPKISRADLAAKEPPTRTAFQSLPPAVDQFPPRQPHPLVEVRLRPLAMSPPLDPKLSGIVSRGDAEAVIGCRFGEDAERSARAIVGSDQHHPCSANRPEPAANTRTNSPSTRAAPTFHFVRPLIARAAAKLMIEGSLRL
jgi:hypothetical protein